MHNSVNAVQGYSFLQFNAQYFLYIRMEFRAGSFAVPAVSCLLVTFPFGTLHSPIHFDVPLSLLSIKGEKKKIYSNKLSTRILVTSISRMQPNSAKINRLRIL